MEEGRFAPPGAAVADVWPAGEPPPEALKKIRHAWIAGLFSAGLTAVILVANGNAAVRFAWADVVLILGLTLGISRRSRVCALAMFVYFVVSKLLQASQGGYVGGLVWGLVFVYIYGQGVAGTFAYHRWLKSADGER